MVMSTTWTTRDLDIVATLTRRVRMLSFGQIARIWWAHSCSSRTARDRLRLLVAGGLLVRTILNVRLVRVERPLSAWRPGQEEPNSDRVSAKARGRWQMPARPLEAFTASKLAGNLFGSSAGRVPDVVHRDHDLLLGEVFVLYRTDRPQEASCWLGENALPKAGFRVKDPDAFLMRHDGRPWRVVESAGSYSSAQIESFHEHCREYDLPYELW